jgi:ABC-type lipoprotein export system ATPase subunit
MDDDAAARIIDFLTDAKNQWTLIVTSKNPYWKQKCMRVIEIQEGKINNDILKS